MKAILVLLLALSLQACLSEESRSPQQSKPVPVRAIEYGKESGSTVLEFSGTLQENRMVPIAFAVTGRVIAVNVKDGDTLAAGAMIAALDSSSFVDAYLGNLAKLRQAQDAYQRLKPLHDSGAVTEVKFVEVETGLAQAEAMCNLSRKNLDDAKLIAPVPGIVVRKNMEVGQSVSPMNPVLSLVDSRYLDAVFTVPETEVLYIRPGMPMRLRVPGTSDVILGGLITEVGIQADQVSRSYPIRVKLDNRKGRLRMGMACHGEIDLDSKKGEEMTLPIQAILEKTDGTRYVYVVRNQKAYVNEIEVGGFLGKGMRVISGLKVGEHVVVEGAHGLGNGMIVQP